MLRATPIFAVLLAALIGCQQDARPRYETESPLLLPGKKRQVWAVAPVQNLSGQPQVDPVLQADLLYQQLHQVHGLTVIPVDRVVEVLASLQLRQVQSDQQAQLVCETLGADALVVATVTQYDPYYPPKLGASLQLLPRGEGVSRVQNVDPRELARQAAPPPQRTTPAASNMIQVVGMYDAANGSVHAAAQRFGRGRSDPAGPMGGREHLMSMDRFCGFVYHALIADLLNKPQMRR